MIDIIIPVHNDWQYLKHALASIAEQTIKSCIVVYVIDDCSDVTLENIFDFFKEDLLIKYYRLPECKGPGYARQFGINQSNSEYIMFMDADDTLYNAKSVEHMYSKIMQGNDYVSSYELYERYNMITDNPNTLHGKIYARNFIDKMGGKFPNDKYHEDSFFNGLILIHAPINERVEEVTYFYSERKGSLVSGTDEEQFRRLEKFISNIGKVVEIAESHNCPSVSIEKYLKEKNNYLKNIYEKFDIKKQETLTEWVTKNNLKNKILLK